MKVSYGVGQMQACAGAAIFQGSYLTTAVYQSAPIPDPKIPNYF